VGAEVSGDAQARGTAYPLRGPVDAVEGSEQGDGGGDDGEDRLAAVPGRASETPELAGLGTIVVWGVRSADAAERGSLRAIAGWGHGSGTRAAGVERGSGDSKGAGGNDGESEGLSTVLGVNARGAMAADPLMPVVGTPGVGGTARSGDASQSLLPARTPGDSSSADDQARTTPYDVGRGRGGGVVSKGAFTETSTAVPLLAVVL